MTNVYYFTFMGYQSALKRKYVKLRGTYASTRRIMMRHFGDQWAFQYSEQEFLPQIERFGLTELPLEDMDE